MRGGGGDDDEGWNSMNTTTATTATSPGRRAARRSDEEHGEGGLLGGPTRGSGADSDSESDSDDDSANDDFLDRPLYDMYSPRNPWSILNFTAHHTRRGGRSLITRVFQRLYGKDVPMHEIRRVLCLSSTLFFMIGAYWLLRSLKDPVLTTLCGVAAIPKAKMLSVFVVLGVVSIYNKLLSTEIPKHRLFYIFGSFYFATFSVIAYLLKDEQMGMANQIPDPSRYLGWVSYCAIESFGSVMVSLFWSFANSVTSLESAKATYGLLVAMAQLGSILGPTLVNHYTDRVGVPNCYQMGATGMLLLQLTMLLYISLYGTEMHDYRTPYDRHAKVAAVAKKPERKNKAGVLEGLVLFARYNYIKGIFAISCLFMVEVTIVDFTMKVLAKDHFSELFPCQAGMSCWDIQSNAPLGMSQGSTEAFAKFMGLFGQATNTLSFLMSLLGTSAVIRTLGLRLTLLLFPSLCLVVIVLVRINPTLWMVFGAMMMLKGFSYALNNPTKEILYQPTSNAVKFKAKSWIDIFGARGSKALGSVVTNAFSDSASALVAHGSIVGMAVASFLIWNARFMGKRFDDYTASGYIVGSEEEDEARREDEAEMMKLAVGQNLDPYHDDKDDGADDRETTSCAIDEDRDEDEVDKEDLDADIDDLITAPSKSANTPTNTADVVSI